MERKYAGFVPFIDEAAWWLNEIALGNRDCTCTRCGGEFYEAAMCDECGLCLVCSKEVMSAEVVIVEPEWCERRAECEAWLSARCL